MTFSGRLWVMGALIAAALAVYGTARYYSPSLMIFVTEQTLIQKSPAGTNTGLVHKRFHAYLSTLPDSESRVAAVMGISRYLEKIQQLSTDELDRLLATD
jgi:hypothetical protein